MSPLYRQLELAGPLTDNPQESKDDEVQKLLLIPDKQDIKNIAIIVASRLNYYLMNKNIR